MKIQSSHINYMPRIQVQMKPQGACCPHGSPAGTCPACLGMGGGGGGSTIKPKPTAHELGLLTWADLLPAWNAMQAAKFRKENEQKLEKLLEIKNLIEQSRVYKAINNFFDNKIMPLVKLLNSQVLTPLTKALNQAIQTINNIYTELKAQLMQQLTKLAGVLNEKLQQIMDKIKQATEMFKNAMEIFISNYKDKEKAVKEFLTAFANKLKKKLFRIVEATDNSFEHLEEQKDNADDYEELINV